MSNRLKEVDLESCSEITDITPLAGYSGLDYQNLEKITAPDWMEGRHSPGNGDSGKVWSRIRAERMSVRNAVTEAPGCGNPGDE